MHSHGHGSVLYNLITVAETTIDSMYVEGLSVTHGVPGHRKHIWTLAAAFTGFPLLPCPCTNSNSS